MISRRPEQLCQAQCVEVVQKRSEFDQQKQNSLRDWRQQTDSLSNLKQEVELKQNEIQQKEKGIFNLTNELRRKETELQTKIKLYETQRENLKQ